MSKAYGRRRKNSDATLPRTMSKFLPKLSARRKLSRTCFFEKAGERQLLSLDGKIKAVLPVPPKVKMISIAKKFLDITEPEKTTVIASVAFKHFVGGSPTSSSSMMFRERTKTVNLTLDDGMLKLQNISVGTGRKTSFSSQVSNGSTISRSSRIKKKPVTLYHLSTLLDIRMSKTKANTFALVFFTDQENGQDENSWDTIPDMTQINIKIDQNENLDQWMTTFLQQLKFLTAYNQQLIQQFNKDLKNAHVSTDTEQGKALQNNVERLIRVNVDLFALIYGYQSKQLADEYATLGIYLSNSGDKYNEAQYWTEKAVRQKEVIEHIVKDEILQKIRDTLLDL